MEYVREVRVDNSVRIAVYTHVEAPWHLQITFVDTKCHDEFSKSCKAHYEPLELPLYDPHFLDHCYRDLIMLLQISSRLGITPLKVPVSLHEMRRTNCS